MIPVLLHAPSVKAPVLAIIILFEAQAPADRRAGGDETEAVEVILAGYSSTQSVTAGPAMAGKIRIDEAHVSLRDLRFRPAEGCNQTARATVVRGPILAELVSRRTSGLDSVLSLPRTRYCGLDVGLLRAGGGTGVSSLEGHSVLVRGRRDDGVRFLIRTRRRALVALVARDPKGFALPGSRPRLFLAVDFGRWLDGIDLSSLVPGRGRNGIIRIDERSHREFLQRFEANLQTGFSLCKDEDDDSIPSPRECAPDHRLASPDR